MPGKTRANWRGALRLVSGIAFAAVIFAPWAGADTVTPPSAQGGALL